MLLNQGMSGLTLLSRANLKYQLQLDGEMMLYGLQHLIKTCLLNTKERFLEGACFLPWEFNKSFSLSCEKVRAQIKEVNGRLRLSKKKILLTLKLPITGEESKRENREMIHREKS
jgi:hypothetical protein